MSLQVLISTLNGDPKKLIKNMHLNSDAIIVNQCNKNSIITHKHKKNFIKIINTTDRGIGKSRELALKNATADILLFADDDEILVDDYEQKITKVFDSQPKADFIIFNIDDKNSDRQHGGKSQKIKNIHSWNCFRYGTARFAVRRESIIQNDVSFDTQFGAATYSHGEDSVFIKDCLAQGLKIIAYPMLIARLTNERKSSWFKGHDKFFFTDTGAILARTFGICGCLIIPLYIFYKYKKEKNIFKKIFYTFNGFWAFIKHRARQNVTIRHRLLEIAIVFCSIFSFKIYGWFNSTMLTAIVLLIYFIFNKKYRSICLSFFKNQHIKKVFILLLTLILWGLFTILYNNSDDFSYIKLLLHLVLNLLVALAVFAFFKKYNRTNQIVNSIMVAFLIQVFCEWVFVIFPSFSELFNFARTDIMVEKSDHYHNFRGIAISTFGFFSLSIAHCVANLIYWTKYNTLFKSSIIKTIVFVFLLSGAFFAGRTALVSLLFIPFIIWRKQSPYSREKIRVAREIITLIIVSIITIIVSLSIPRMHSAFNFITEPFRNITSSHKVQTTSTNSLIQMYQTAFEEAWQHNFLTGDGYYTTETNNGVKYYGGIDIGFIRKFYFFGIVGFILSFIFQIAIFGKTIRDRTTITILIMLCLLELKGEVIGASIIVNTILFLYSLSASETITKIRGNPLVSVIIPTYGRSSKIANAIQSIKDQTYTNVEIIVVDDNVNNEEAREATQKTVAKFGDIKYIKNSHNLGGGGSRNQGIKAATGEYIAFLDDDDEYEPTKIEKQLALMQEKENQDDRVGLIYCWRTSISADQKHRKTIKNSWEGIPLCKHMCYMTAPTSCWLCSKKAIHEVGGFDKVPSQQDAIFILKLLSMGFSIYCVRDALVKYYEHSDADGITKRSSTDYFNRVILYQKLCRTHFDKLSKSEQARVEFYFQSRQLNLYLDQNNKNQAKKILIAMYKKRPLNIQNLKNLIKIIIK